jgi:DNA ligase-1
MSETAFVRLANLGEQLEHTTKRNEIVTLLAQFLQGLAPEEVAPAVRLTIGQVFPEWDGRTLNMSWAAVMAVVDQLTGESSDLREQLSAQAVDGGEYVRLLLEHARSQPPSPPPLMILEVFHAFQQIAETSGAGSRARKEALLQTLFRRATPVEAKYLSKVIFQEMRHGVNEGLMLEGIAQASGIKSALVRRANQLWGDIGEVALVALTQGKAALENAGVRLFRPLKPMLAQTAENLDEAFVRFGDKLALEYKLDGARMQIHRRGDQVRIYSRNLADVTDSLPDVVDEVKASEGSTECILEGEAIAVDSRGRPLPFQHLMRRFGRKRDVTVSAEEIPVQLHLFDALYVNERSLIDASYQERWSALEQAAGSLNLVRRLVPRTIEEGKAFAEGAYLAGHEGVMIKELESTYTPGVRGQSWLKLKHVMSVDLVIVAADWGYGRRHGWLSNYHLAALDEETGDYLVVGKTFKGLTDEEFKAMTTRLLGLEYSRRRSTVYVLPQVVVEVLFNEIQASSQYKSGLALRFARITRLRDDKASSEADTLQTLRRLYELQFRHKGQLRQSNGS